MVSAEAKLEAKTARVCMEIATALKKNLVMVALLN